MLWCTSVFTQLLPKPPGRNVKSPLRLSEASAFFFFMLLLKSHVLVKLLLSSVFFSLYNFFWFDSLVDWTGLQISAIQTGCWIAQISAVLSHSSFLTALNTQCCLVLNNYVDFMTIAGSFQGKCGRWWRVVAVPEGRCWHWKSNRLRCIALFFTVHESWKEFHSASWCILKSHRGSGTQLMSRSNGSHWPSWDIDRYSATLAESTFAFLNALRGLLSRWLRQTIRGI